MMQDQSVENRSVESQCVDAQLKKGDRSKGDWSKIMSKIEKGNRSKMSLEEENYAGLSAGGRSVLALLAHLRSSVSSVLWSLHVVKK